MRISTRILMAFAVVIGLMAGVALLDYRTAETSKRHLDEYQEHLALLMSVQELETQVLELQRSVAIFATTGHASLARRVERIDATIQETLEAIRAGGTEADLAGGAIHGRLDELRGDYMEAFGRLAEDRGRRDRLLDDCRQQALDIRRMLEALSGEHADIARAEEAFASSERSLMSYVESPDSAAVRTVKAELRRASEIVSATGGAPTVEALGDYQETFLQMVQAIRGYLFLANVVLAGQAAELNSTTADFRQRFGVSTGELLLRAERNAQRTRSRNTALIILAMIGGLSVSWRVGRDLGSHIGQITQTLARLARGERVDSIPGLERSDEVGAMAAAAQVFKERNQQTEELLELSRSRGTQLQRQALELSRANAELEQFAYVASHDLQEPLRMVASYVQLLGQEYGETLDEDAHEYIGFASEGAKRMQALINDLLDLSRVGRTAAQVEPVDTRALVQAVCRDLHHLLGETEVVLESLPTLPAYENLLRQVVQNFLTNAVKYRRKDVPLRLRVSSEKQADGWVLSFEDNGIGIAQKHSERIFKVFQRLHPRSQYEGSGMGLAIVKKIAEQHHGRVWVESSEGRGSTFKLLIGHLTAGEETPSTTRVAA